jgi:pimeloyl-ACP methyl ester carboxylesterase
VLVSFVLAATTMAAAATVIAPGPPGDAFYTPPSRLPSTVEGAVIWARPFSGGSTLRSAETNYRLLYETISPSGKFVAVSGSLSIPHGAPPARGWPLISWAHGTVGNAPDCAPSRETGPNVEQRMLDGFVQRGYAVAQTDYEGNGTPGIHPYMVATAAARDATDIVVASRQLIPQIGRDWVVMGHSEGGASALSTAALAQQIAPNLNLLGAVAYAPFTYPEATLAYELHNGAPNGGLAILGLLIEGYATVDPRVVPSQILEQEFMPHLAELQQQCIDEIMERSDWRTVVPSNVFRPEGQSSVEALYADLRQNDPAYFTITVPTLIVNGVSDTMVSSEGSITVADRLRKSGTPVTFKAYLGATHGSVLRAANGDVAAWVAQRFAGATP